MPTFVTDEVVTATKLNNATARDWTTWTPTLTNLNVGTTGTVVARYCQIGSEAVLFRFTATLGGTGISVGQVEFSLPVTASTSGYVSQTPIGPASYFDSSASQSSMGWIRMQSATTARFALFTTSAQQGTLSSTTPFTWAAADVLTCQATYEVA